MYRSILSTTKQPLNYMSKRSFGGGHGHCHHTAYPLLGALTVAVSAASYTIYRNIRYNPDTQINRLERHAELKEHLRDNADSYYHHGVRDRVLKMAAEKEAKAKRMLENKITEQ